jgi:hypothetical protein
MHCQTWLACDCCSALQVCGITNVDDAKHAAEQGADLIGAAFTSNVHLNLPVISFSIFCSKILQHRPQPPLPTASLAFSELKHTGLVSCIDVCVTSKPAMSVFLLNLAAPS